MNRAARRKLNKALGQNPGDTAGAQAAQERSRQTLREAVTGWMRLSAATRADGVTVTRVTCKNALGADVEVLITATIRPVTRSTNP